MRPAANMPDRATAVLVRRILRLYDPWYVLGLTRRGLAARLRSKTLQPVEHVEVFSRADEYHPARVLWFVNRLRSGRRRPRMDPISLDNSFDRWFSLVGLVLVDGHHRLIAAAVTQQTWITCTYSGRVDLLEWLKGNRRLRPPELR